MGPMTKLREPEPVSTGSAADFIPPNSTLPKLREAARSCRGCDLWVNATQTVFGEGPSPADVMFVGEALGDLVKPRVIVALGATAAAIIATVHPSAVLRAPDGERERARRDFVAYLKRVATYLGRPKAKVAGSR